MDDARPLTVAPDWQPSAAVIESLARLLRGLPSSFDDDEPPPTTPTTTPAAKRRRR
jgi:hypothetical protein